MIVIETRRTYRFGQVLHTAEEIGQIARRHGEDGIEYYPPQCWGGTQPMAIALPTRQSDCWTGLEQLYHASYVEDFYRRHPELKPIGA